MSIFKAAAGEKADARTDVRGPFWTLGVHFWTLVVHFWTFGVLTLGAKNHFGRSGLNPERPNPERPKPTNVHTPNVRQS